MTNVYSTEGNTRFSVVTFQNSGCIKKQKYKDISNLENNIFCVIPLEVFLSKSEICDMTLMSGAFDKSVIDGNTILLYMKGEYGRYRYVRFGRDMICFFLTNDNNYKNIANMGNNLTPYSIAVGDENVYFSTPHFKFIKREKIFDKELLETNKSSVDPFDYHVSNCGKYSSKKIRKYKNHSNDEN